MRLSRLTLLLVACILVSAAGNAAFAEGFKLPSYDARTAPYGNAPWVDGTHYFHEMTQKFIAENGVPDHRPAKAYSPKAVGQKEEFFVMNVQNNQAEKRPAILRKIGKNCYLYVEEGREYADAVLQNLVDRFDGVIYKTDTETFGSEPKPGIDNDPRITILMVDIRDGWEPGKGYVGGYFFPLDCFSTNVYKNSNEREIIYLDCYPSKPEDPMYLGVIAHEFEHMIHFNNDPKEGKWVNEGCAQLAFYACGYDHPPQILSYIAKPSHTATNWKNTLEDYGVGYLLQYYLYQKYAGANFADRQNFYRALVASKLNGIESIDAILKQTGVAKTFEEIFKDWVVANVINRPELDRGQYGYDKTLTMRIHTTHDFTSLPAGFTKVELEDHGVANMLFTPFASHLPEYPTKIEKFAVYSKKPGVVAWGVNGWQAPPSAYVPAGSSNAAGVVETKLSGPDAKGLYSAEFGPFAGAGAVEKFNFRRKYEDGTVSKDETVTIIGPNGRDLSGAREEEKNALVVDFKGDGGKGRFVVMQIVEDRDGNVAVGEVPLRDGTASIVVPSYGNAVARVYLAAYPTGAKKMKFDVSARAATAREVEAIPNAYMMIPRWLGAGKIEQGTDAAGASVSARSAAVAGAAAAADGAGARKDENGDTSHENFGYLVWKAKDNIHLLTNLKIDPGFLEGQILEMYKLLQITMNLPHLPIPDGFAIKDYNCSAMFGWVGSIGEANGTAADRESLKRIINGAPALADAYNNSLFLADDALESSWCMVQFAYRSIGIVNNVAAGLANVPVAGSLAAKAKYMIRAKLVEVLNSAAVLVAPHIPPKYGKYLPTAVWVLTTVYSGITHTNANEQQLGSTVGTVVKLLGKYLLASLPKAGFVDRTQRSVDRLGRAAIDHAFEGTLEECNRAVASKTEAIADNVKKIREADAKDRQMANLAGALAQLSAYGTAIDPTSITKIAAIALGATSGGFYVHSIYVPFREYLMMDDHMENIVDLQIAGKERPAAATKWGSLSGVTYSCVDASAFLDKYVGDCRSLAAKVGSGAGREEVAKLFEAVCVSDERLAYALGSERVKLSATREMRDRAEFSKGIAAFDEFSLRQAAFYGDVIAYASGRTKNVSTTGDALFASAEKIGATMKRFNGSKLYKTCAIESLKFSQEVMEGQEFVVMASVRNVSAASMTTFTVTLDLPNILQAQTPVSKRVQLAAGESQTVSFRVRALTPLYDVHETALMVSAEASDETTIPGSRISYIQVKKFVK